MSEKEKKQGFLDRVREIDEKERRMAYEEEAREKEEQARRDEEERRTYAEKLRQEKVELMKLKQGMISESDIPAEDTVVKKYSLWEKISNFFYHNKAYVIVGVLFAALAIFLIYDLATKENPDIQVLYIASDYDMSYYSSELTPLWSEYGEDYNDDGEKLVRMYYVPTGYADDANASLYYAQSDRTKLMGEFQSGVSVMIIGDKNSYESLGISEGVFYDCRELFPDDPYAEEIGYRVQGTDLMELMGCETVDDSQLYVSFRIPYKTMGMSEKDMQENFDHAVEFWKNFLAEHRVDGLELEPTREAEHIVGYGEDYEDEEQE